MANEKMIECPAHKGAHIATLYLQGHQYAGIWECPVTGESGSCEHISTHVEDVENWPTGPEDLVYTSEVYVCDACEITVDGDPAADRAESLLEMAD